MPDLDLSKDSISLFDLEAFILVARGLSGVSHE